MSSKTAYHFGDVVSAVRREAGLTQYDLAKRMGISQPNLSKLEGNQLRPSADVWFDFCESFGVPFDSYKMGYIDSTQKKVNDSNIPEKYKINAVLRVRFLIPIFENLKLMFGDDYFYETLKKLGVDYYLLTIRDTLVNFNFLSELFELLNLDPDKYDFKKAADIAAYDFVHGRLWDRLNNKDVVKVTNILFKKIESYIDGYYIQREIYSNSQIKLVIPPFPTRPSYLNYVGLIEKINFNYLPNFIKSLVESDSQVQFLDEGPTFQIYIKGNL